MVPLYKKVPGSYKPAMLKYVSLLRPHQWIKNLLLLFPPFFGGTILDQELVTKLFPALFAFCTAASASYIINDVRDVEKDKKHAIKRDRAIANGDISAGAALLLAFILFLTALVTSFIFSPGFGAYLSVYLIISLSYTFFLKDIVIIDIFFISFGFLIRVLAGGEAFGTEVSSWLFMTVFLVSLFLATGKRAGELISMGDDAGDHRRSLAAYSISFLEGTLWFSASAALVTYGLYTLEQQSGLFYTVPLAAFGLLRYIYIVKEGRGDPTDALLKDPQLLAVGIIWAIVIGMIVYGPR